MVGDGVLRWLIASPQVNRIVAVSRKPLQVQHPKLTALGGIEQRSGTFERLRRRS